MTKEDRLRRVVLLCCHFARNLAYYHAGWDKGKLRKTGDFWITVNGNFIDTCVLEWCKLFGESSGEHYWGTVVSDRGAFEASLYGSIGMSAAEFEAYRLEMREYRDKFLAHLDRELVANIPNLDKAMASACFYHAHVVTNEAPTEVFKGLPLNLKKYEYEKTKEAQYVYNA